MYTPEPFSLLDPSVQELSRYVQTELARISDAFMLVQQGRFLPIMSAAPSKPREGMLVVADGTTWNPGSGKGLYEYRSGTWQKL